MLIYSLMLLSLCWPCDELMNHTEKPPQRIPNESKETCIINSKLKYSSPLIYTIIVFPKNEADIEMD